MQAQLCKAQEAYQLEIKQSILHSIATIDQRKRKKDKKPLHGS